MGCSQGKAAKPRGPTLAGVGKQRTLRHLPYSEAELPIALEKLHGLFNEVNKSMVQSGNDRQEAILNFRANSPDAGQQLLGYNGQLLLKDGVGVVSPEVQANCKEFVRIVCRTLNAAEIGWYRPLVKPVKGALTRRHTDVFRGNHRNAVFFLELQSDSGMVIRTDIQFRTSVVQLDG